MWSLLSSEIISTTSTPHDCDRKDRGAALVVRDYYAPAPHRVGHNALMAVVCPVPSRMEVCSKLKIGRKEAHDTGDR